MSLYLQIPEDISGFKCKLFAFLKDNLQNWVNRWIWWWLSRWGKEVGLNIFLYISWLILCLASCFCRRYVRDLWVWLDKMGNHCLPREKSGIGFCMIYKFNLALLAKRKITMAIGTITWLFVSSSFGRKYYQMSSPLRASTTENPSYVWTNISAARKLLLLGIRHKILRIWSLCMGRSLASYNTI